MYSVPIKLILDFISQQCWLLCIILFSLNPCIGISAQLFKGQSLYLGGVNSFVQPTLIGLIVRDELIPFEIADNNGSIILSGILEDRVVKSSDLGSYIFQSRIREVTGTEHIQIKKISFSGYRDMATNAEFLLNGIGDVTPSRAQRSIDNGDQITYHYDVGIIPQTESSFTTISTNSIKYDLTGQTRITASNEQDTFTTVVTTAAPLEPRPGVIPQQGFWWNPLRPGHGIDVQLIKGNTMFVLWYTYRDNRTPVWYLGSGTFTGDSWQASMNVFRWDGTQAIPQSTGQFGLDFTDDTHAIFWWQFNGKKRLQEAFEIFKFSHKKAAVDYSGTYFEKSKPGYGLSLSIQGDTEFSVLYFYDENGHPTWATGLNNHCIDTNYNLNSLRGFCPSCAMVTPTSESIGKISLEMLSNNQGILLVNANLNPPLLGNWKVDKAAMSNLSFSY